MMGLFCFVVVTLGSPFKSRLRLEAENAALRLQLMVLRRRLPPIDTGRTVLNNAPIVQVQPRAPQFLPGSSADQAEQRRESKFDAMQRKLDEEFDNNLNICNC
jgi:hypothetical protein